MKFKISKEWCKKSAELEGDAGGILACSPEIFAQMSAMNDKFNQLSLKEKIRYLKLKEKEFISNNKELINNISNSRSMKNWEKKATDKFVKEQFEKHEIKK